jgi:putative tryptophan/tyrosine transport system substrate-binding protein
MQRREFITLIGGAVAGWPLAARAQQAARTYRVASVWVATEATVRSLEQAFLAVLTERGYVVGRNLLYESRYANGEPTRLPALVDELIAFKPDVLAGIEPVVRVMMSKTSTVPIVMTNASDPVAAGLVNSLSKPGGNVTGVSFQYDELGPKLIELTREILPNLSRVGHILDSTIPGSKVEEANARQAARKLGIVYVPYYVASRAEVETAFAQMQKDRLDALVQNGGSGMMFGLRQMQIDNALRLRVPLSTGLASYAEMGALMSFGPNLEDGFRLAATYVDQILKGAKPGDLPVEQPTRFRLVINLKTAKALGLTVPPALIARADDVIQ